MLNIELTINGKPATDANIEEAFEKTIFEGIIETVKESITNAITAEEAAKITVNVVGSDINNLSFNIKGPEEIVDKINTALSDS